MESVQSPNVEVQMLVRRPVEVVFNAFIDPAVTCHFWFTKGSGKLETGKTVLWEWEMYGVSSKVVVKDIISNKEIWIEWGEPATSVLFSFESYGDHSTYVVIKNWGFAETGDALIDAIKNNTGGFTTVIDGLKVYLEHDIKPNLIGDKFPPGLVKH